MRNRMPFRRTAAVLLVGLVAGGHAFADEPATAAVADAAARTEADDVTLPTAAPAPRWTAGGTLRPDGYRMSVARGALGLGMRFEPRIVPLRPTETPVEPTTLTLPAVSVELRSVAAQPAAASSLAERALGAGSDGTTVSKVGIEWKPAQSQIFFRGGVGVRLSGDDSVVMRLRKGTLGFYMQRNF